MRNMIKKVVVPVLVIAVLFAETALYPGWEVQLFIAVASDGDTVWNWKNVCLDGSKRI
jgi:hypothetical protein